MTAPFSTPLNTIGQILSILAMAVAILSFQFRKNRPFYIAQGTAGLLFSLSYFCIGNPASGIINMLNIGRGAALAVGGRFSRRRWAVGFCALYAVSAAYSISRPGAVVWTTVMVTAAQLVGTAAMWTRDGRIIRYAQLFVSPCWLVNNIVFRSTGAIVTEIFAIVSVIVSFIRFGAKGMEKESV